MSEVSNTFSIFLGAGIGGALRHAVNRGMLFLVGPNFPAGTLTVNVVGCLVMGLLAGWFTVRGEDTTPAMRLFLTTGILGGFTTFSTFSLDVLLLWERGEAGLAIAYMLASVILSLGGVVAGMSFIRMLQA